MLCGPGNASEPEFPKCHMYVFSTDFLHFVKMLHTPTRAHPRAYTEDKGMNLPEFTCRLRLKSRPGVSRSLPVTLAAT